MSSLAVFSMHKWYWEDDVRRIVLMVFTFILWILLTTNFHWQSLLTGGIAALITGLVFGAMTVTDPFRALNPVRWFWMLVYIPVFTWEMAKANFDVAYRVIHPKRPIDPGIVRVRTRIKSEMGKTFLANSITLTPGTFTVDIKEDILYIHCIKVRHTDLEDASKDIIGRFEPLLIKIFD